MQHSKIQALLIRSGRFHLSSSALFLATFRELKRFDHPILANPTTTMDASLDPVAAISETNFAAI